MHMRFWRFRRIWVWIKDKRVIKDVHRHCNHQVRGKYAPRRTLIGAAMSPWRRKSHEN